MKDYPTVLAEFLSVVTDTQEYIMPAPESTNDLLIEQEAQQVQAVLVAEWLMLLIISCLIISPLWIWV